MTSVLLFFLSVIRKKQLPPRKDGEIDPKIWELLLSAQKKDYGRICIEFGVTDFRWLLKKLNLMKKERLDEQAKVRNAVNITFCNCKSMFNLNTTIYLKL